MGVEVVNVEIIDGNYAMTFNGSGFWLLMNVFDEYLLQEGDRFDVGVFTRAEAQNLMNEIASRTKAALEADNAKLLREG